MNTEIQGKFYLLFFSKKFRLRINQQTISSESVNKKSSVLQGSGKCKIILCLNNIIVQEKSINSRHENPDKKGTIINNNLNRDEIQSVKNTIADSQGENFLLGRKRNAEIPGKSKFILYKYS